MTSQITPAGIRPARRARSTAASVCPVRSSTPPGRARSGKTWPGWTRSPAPRLGSMAVWIVAERSAAEIPVVTPSRASIEIVKAVWSGASLFSAIGLSPSSSHRSGVRQRQMRPRACVAMKLIASGVANCAAIVRSPSFSRSAASTTITNLPCRTSSIASSMVANGLVGGRGFASVAISRIVTGLLRNGFPDEFGDVEDDVCALVPISDLAGESADAVVQPLVPLVPAHVGREADHLAPFGAASPLEVEENRCAVLGLDHAVEIRLVRQVRSATRPVGPAHPARDPAFTLTFGDQEVLTLDATFVVQLDEPGLGVVKRQAVQRL